MNKFEWGRKSSKPGESKKKEGKPDAAGAAALICAVICARSLCLFTLGGASLDDNGSDAAAVPAAAIGGKPSYAEKPRAEEWSIWNYFSDLLSNVFRVNTE